MNDDNHKTLQEFAMGEIIKELRAERDALKAELNDTKTAADDFFNTGRIWEQKLVDCQKSFRELTWENNRLKAELEATRNQEPCGWQSRFITPTETWGFCSKEHYETVKAAPHEYPGYEVRAVYASPVPARQPTGAILITDCTLRSAAIVCRDYAQLVNAGELLKPDFAHGKVKSEFAMRVAADISLVAHHHGQGWEDEAKRAFWHGWMLASGEECDGHAEFLSYIDKRKSELKGGG